MLVRGAGANCLAACPACTLPRLPTFCWCMHRVRSSHVLLRVGVAHGIGTDGRAVSCRISCFQLRGQMLNTGSAAVAGPRVPLFLPHMVWLRLLPVYMLRLRHISLAVVLLEKKLVGSSDWPPAIWLAFYPCRTRHLILGCATPA